LSNTETLGVLNTVEVTLFSTVVEDRETHRGFCWKIPGKAKCEEKKEPFESISIYLTVLEEMVEGRNLGEIGGLASQVSLSAIF
jgi:hypothetical protein